MAKELVKKNKLQGWSLVTFVVALFFLIAFAYPLFMLLKSAFLAKDGAFTLANFQKFFSTPYYFKTIGNSFKVSFFSTVVCLLIGIPFSYFYTFYC